ncbi:MAG: prephenate dehydratase domain-containing protein [Chloroflexota bacterium]
MISHMLYLGPENTWSHAAALRAKRLLPDLAQAELEPIAASSMMFDKLREEKAIAAIVPTYNLEQGIVYDFARFHLFEEIGALELKTRMCLFGSAETLSKLNVIYTKDTVVPQVSQWLSELPEQIKIVAKPEISTALGVQMAAAEPFAGAICSEAAGKAHGLRPLALGIANNPENYTAFSIFKQPENFFQPSILDSPPEYSFGIDSVLADQIKGGGLSVLWHIESRHNKQLHLGHMSAVLTLHKLAHYGNRLVIQVEDMPNAAPLVSALKKVFEGCEFKIIGAPDRRGIFAPLDVPLIMQDLLEARANIRGCDRMPGREAQRLSLFCNHQVLLHALEQTGVDLVVAGPSLLPDLKMLAEHSDRIIPTILTDYLPGTDNYAKMSARRMNQIDWPLSSDLSEISSEKLNIHFQESRFKSSSFQAQFSQLFANEPV